MEDFSVSMLEKMIMNGTLKTFCHVSFWSIKWSNLWFLSFEGSWSLPAASACIHFTHSCTPAPIFPPLFSPSLSFVPPRPSSHSLLIMWPWSQNRYPTHRVVPPASHNELFSHSGWTGQKWPAGELLKEREMEKVRQKRRESEGKGGRRKESR